MNNRVPTPGITGPPWLRASTNIMCIRSSAFIRAVKMTRCPPKLCVLEIFSTPYAMKMLYFLVFSSGEQNLIHLNYRIVQMTTRIASPKSSNIHCSLNYRIYPGCSNSSIVSITSIFNNTFVFLVFLIRKGSSDEFSSLNSV